MPGLLKTAFIPGESRNRLLQDGPWWNPFGFNAALNTNAGVTLDDDKLISFPTILLALRIISEDLSGLPFVVFEKSDGRRKKDRAENHPLFGLIHDEPNPEQTSLEFRRQMMANLLVYWRAYAFIDRGPGDRPVALWPLPAQMVEPKRTPEGQRIYIYKRQLGQEITFTEDEIFPLTGWHINGFHGDGPLRWNKEAIGLMLALEEYASRFFGQGANVGGVVTYPGKLRDAEAKEQFRKSIHEKYGGLGKSHHILALEEGSEFTPTGVNPEQAQAVEARKFSVTECSRMWRIPPHMLMDLERATFSNIEQQAIDYVKHTLLPWIKLWEQRVNKDLFFPSERRRFQAEMVVDGLLRGDSKARWEGYQIAIQQGVLTRNEVRDLENRNPIDGLDRPLQPLNMVPVGEELDDPDEIDGDADTVRGLGSFEMRQQRARARLRTRERFVSLVRDAAQRLVKREVREVRKAIDRNLKKRDAASMLAWIHKFYEKHPDVVREVLGPSLLALADSVAGDAAREVGGNPGDILEFMDDYLRALGEREAGSSRGQLLGLLREAEDAAGAMENRLEEWIEKRADKIAERETIQAEGAIAREVWRRSGISKLQWRAAGKNCPFCDALNGKIVGIQKLFVVKNDVIGSDDDDRLEHVYRAPTNITHPPLHGGCDCFIVPA